LRTAWTAPETSICSPWRWECRIAGLDTSAIAVLLGEKNEELVDSIRPEIWENLEQLIAQRARGRMG
jgi:hypothetical protein